MGHAQLSPSDSSRWLNCTACIQICEEIAIKEEQYSECAEEGTAAHELAGMILTSKEDSKVFLGLVLNAHPVHRPQGFVVDKEMVSYVDTYVSYIYEKMDLETDTLLTEYKVPLFYSPKETGTTDAAFYNEATKTLHIFDLKYGRGVKVSGENNSQMLIYGISIMDVFNELGLCGEIERLVTHIVQPRISHIESWEYSLAELEAFRLITLEKVELIRNKKGIASPSDKACRWCPASGSCKAQSDFYMKEVYDDFPDLTKVPQTHLMSADEIARILTKADEISAFLNAVHAVASEMLSRGIEVPGFKLVHGNTHRKWKDDKLAEKFLKDRLKIDQVFTSKLISPSAAEKVLDIDKMSTRSQNVFKELVEKPIGQPCLVPESDKRPSISSVLEDFDDLTTTQEEI
jgi:hypothetical protein